MGIIKPWNSVYPVAVDDLVTNFPVLIDGVDTVIADHSNELAKAVVALETEQQTLVTTVSTLDNITLQHTGVTQTASLRTLNVTGSGVSVSTAGSDVTLTFSGSGGSFPVYTSSANSGYTMPNDTAFMEYTAGTGAISSNLPATTPAVGTTIQVSLQTSNAGGLTLVAPGGVTIQGASSFLLPGSDAAPSTTADRAWQLRVVAPNTWRVA